MIMNILYAFFAVAFLGGALGLGLAFAAKKLAIEKDERIIAVEAALPGANCGACGFAGCAAYAEAIVMEGAAIGLCPPGGQESANAVSEIMGVSSDFSATKMVAKVHCYGNNEVSSKDFTYRGITDCNSAHILFQGDKSCKFGCLALGSCIKVCPVNAITKNEKGMIEVDKEVCISCGKCVTICPTGVMKMIPYDADYFIACNSKDKGAVVKKSCKVGCIGCKICEKKFPEAGFIVTDFLSEIDYTHKGIDRDGAAEACPVHCIVKIK